MFVVKEYPDGVFSWVDLATTSVDGANEFYGGLFGWSPDITYNGDVLIYSMSQLDGHNVAGVGPIDEDFMTAGMPVAWTSYVNHSDADAVAKRVAAAGGAVMVEPMDIFDSGRMGIFQDPTGAVFGVWQPKAHIGAQLVNMPNTLTWNELQTNDVEAAKTFYAAVFDWTYETDEGGYVLCNADGRGQAGMMAIQEDWGDVPSNWAVYFLVEDADEAFARATKLGATALSPVSAAGSVGRFALLQDPQGGVFNIIEYAGDASPPPGAE